MECQICCRDAVDADSIGCPYCHFECCEECAEKFLVSDVREPSCMMCRKVWSREFVLSNFDGDWLRKGFLPHLGMLLLDREKSMLPQAQAEAVLEARVRALTSAMRSLESNAKIERKYKSNAALLEEKLAAKKSMKESISRELAEIKARSALHGGSSRRADEKSVAVKNYVLKCPCGDCRGYVDDSYVCGTCGVDVCKNCYAPAGEKHSCRKEDVLSARLIEKDTKPCPKCMARIYKVSGCSQMFCTACQTSFDWETGRIETGILHNPHYYEWLAANADKTAARVEDAACGEIPHPQVFLHRLNKCVENDIAKWELLEMYRMIRHIEQTALPAYAENRVKDNLDLRVAYLLGDIDDETWAKKLTNREKKRMKTRAYRELLDMEVALMSDFVRQIMYSSASAASIAQQYRSLKNYHRDAVDEISRIHGGCVPTDVDVFGSSGF